DEQYDIERRIGCLDRCQRGMHTQGASPARAVGNGPIGTEFLPKGFGGENRHFAHGRVVLLRGEPHFDRFDKHGVIAGQQAGRGSHHKVLGLRGLRHQVVVAIEETGPGYGLVRAPPQRNRSADRADHGAHTRLRGACPPRVVRVSDHDSLRMMIEWSGTRKAPATPRSGGTLQPCRSRSAGRIPDLDIRKQSSASSSTRSVGHRRRVRPKRKIANGGLADSGCVELDIAIQWVLSTCSVEGPVPGRSKFAEAGVTSIQGAPRAHPTGLKRTAPRPAADLVIIASMNKPSPPIAPAEVLRPHTPLPAYYGDEVEHEQFLRRIFDDTAPDYDRIERVLALGSGSRYRRAALQRAWLTAGAQVLDVGIGTGLVAREALALIGSSGRVVGVDPSPGMMSEVALPGVELI